MKIISFSAVEILPALLNKKKDQTIRPNWKYDTTREAKGDFVPIILKEPRFKVGEKVKLMWKQRSKYKSFCDKCGVRFNPNNLLGDHLMCKNPNSFDKTLGTGTITEVFEIEMYKAIGKWSGKMGFGLLINGCGSDSLEQKIAKMDGFKNREEMFQWFDKHYDLSTSKKFFVYRWSWD